MARATAKKTTAQKTTARKATARKGVAGKEGTTKKVAAQTVAPVKPTATKSTTRAASKSSKPAAKKAGTSTAKKATAKKTTTPSTGKQAAGSARKLAVKSDEKPWTAGELAEVRGELHSERQRLRSELNLAEEELHDLMRDAGDGAGNDQADVGSTTFERDHEMSLANNARDMLAQIERALGRIEDGTYGVCESCGQPIGKMRLMAYPRATLCLSCKQREERR